LTDGDGTKEVITASMDKTVVLWRLQESTAEVDEIVRLTPPGGPIFSLASDTPKPQLGERQNIFLGNYDKAIVAWEPPSQTLIKKVHLNSHTGWVRALATHGKWLFSSGCNHLRQWDMTRAVPRHAREIKLFTGDILGLCTGGGRVYACTANGAIKAWDIGKLGDLTAAGARDKAHSDRVNACVWHKNFLYSVSNDGSLKMWDATTMELVGEVKKAHDKQKIQCMAVGPDGYLYTGGDDKLVRRWHLGTLAIPEANALYGHNYAVRSLAAGKKDLLVSGDSAGELAIWQV
jgi:pleiotropic regulator 1